MKKKTAHLISHTHWDREWYMPYEYHHVLLIELMDKLLETLELDPEYRYFHLDGQTIILEDYLQIRPERKEKLESFIRQGRIKIGPWYVLQDEFLTSSESNVRNLLMGHRDAKEYGVISKVGYFPDSFGNMGQAPQLLKQAGIENAVFGRGVKPTGFNNMVSASDSYESPYSEMFWRSPDGSEVIGILFANWYCNGMEVPTDPEQAKIYWDQKLREAEEYAATPHLLFMNGCDHQPIQTDLSQAIRVANKLYPELEFKHSNFDDYIREVTENLPDQLATIEGELRSQHTDGWGTLVNTASARNYIKQMNQQCQTLLEKVAEPLAVFAHTEGVLEYPHHLLVYAWKTLMQNHPHDSICGCSVDEVHLEMVTRFAKSKQVAEQIIAQSINALVKKIDTQYRAPWGEDAIPFTVFNTTGWDRSGAVKVELVVAKKYFEEGPTPQALVRELEQLSYEHCQVMSHNGKVVAAEVRDLGVQFGYELPKDRFRKPYMFRKLEVTISAERVPALGYAVYALLPSGVNAEQGDRGDLKAASIKIPQVHLDANERIMENRRMRVIVEQNGSITIVDKMSGEVYAGLNVFENAGDIGNEYMFRQPEGEETLTTSDLHAEIRVVENSAVRISIESVLRWDIPAQADELLERERRELVPFTERNAQRTSQTVPMVLTTTYTLEAESQAVQVVTCFNNQARDHRLRALFPSKTDVAYHHADSVFEVAKRPNKPADEWQNPSNCQHQQAFVSIHDDKRGLTIANKGLAEYEVLPDGERTIAVTLLRAVSELGDWGDFATPDAQCLGEHRTEYAIIPHRGDGGEAGAYRLSYQYQVPWIYGQTPLQQGTLPALHRWVEWNQDESALAFSSLKLAEETGDVIARWYNVTGKKVELKPCVHFGNEEQSVYESDILEHRGSQMDGSEPFRVGGYKIITRSYPLQ